MRRLLGRAVLALALAGATLGPAATSHADEPAPPSPATSPSIDPSELEAVLEQLRSELAESSEAMLRAAADLRLADRALPAARQTAAHAHQLLVAAKARAARTARRRGTAQVRYMLSTQDAEATAAQVAEQQARIGRLARAVYQGGGSLGSVSLLLDARSPNDFAHRLVAFQTVVSAQRSALDDLQSVQQSFGARTDDLAAVRDQLARTDKQAQRDLAAVTALEAEARAAEAEVSRLVETRKAALAAAAAAQAEDDAAHRQLIGESSQLQAQLETQAQRDLGSAGLRDGASIAARAGTFDWPVSGRISSPFGMRVHPITGVYKLHTGTDLSVGCGTPIHVARDGVVISAGWNSAYGWRTVVSHGVVDGVLLTTTYNHQSHIGVLVGDQLPAGSVIGNVGSTGYSTGCHLHFEVYVNSALVDPESWLPAH